MRHPVVDGRNQVRRRRVEAGRDGGEPHEVRPRCQAGSGAVAATRPEGCGREHDGSPDHCDESNWGCLGSSKTFVRWPDRCGARHTTTKEDPYMAKKSRGGRMTAAKRRAAKSAGGRGRIKNRKVGR